jgi:hypothetical protein
MNLFAFLKLLDDKRVIDEVERYKWIESERVGKDIGRERAALEWIRAYGHIWLKIHKPQEYKKLMEGDASNSLDGKKEDGLADNHLRLCKQN